MNFLNIAFYKFVELKNLQEMRPILKTKAVALSLKGTILLSPEGINAFLAGEKEKVFEFLKFLRTYPELSDIDVKESWSEKQPFTRMLVKIKKEIISFGIPEVNPAKKTGPRVSAQELKTWLDENRDVVLIDTRNQYEIKLGTFKNALDLNLKTFRQFPKKMQELAPELKDKTMVMFCTGGIRCEKATALAVQMGFEKAYQLEGGILKYFEEVGGAHYEGECFVFDQRVAVDPRLEQTKAAQCFRCRSPLTAEEQSSATYVPNQSCPYCHSTANSRADL